MAKNSYLTYDPFDFKQLTSGIGAPPSWMFQRPIASYEDAMNTVNQARNGESVNQSNELRLEEAERGREAQQAMADMIGDQDPTNPEVAKKILQVGLSKGGLDEAYKFAQGLNQIRDLEPKREKPEKMQFSPNPYGGYQIFDPNTGQVTKNGPFAIPRAAGGANGQKASIGFLNYETGERISQDEYEGLDDSLKGSFFPEKLAMNKVEAMREGQRRSKKPTTQEDSGPGFLESISSMFQGAVKPSAPAADGPPGEAPPGMKWRRKGSK